MYICIYVYVYIHTHTYVQEALYAPSKTKSKKRHTIKWKRFNEKRYRAICTVCYNLCEKKKYIYTYTFVNVQNILGRIYKKLVFVAAYRKAFRMGNRKKTETNFH